MAAEFQRCGRQYPGPFWRVCMNSEDLVPIEGFGHDKKRNRTYVPEGYQTRTPRRREKLVPDWVYNPKRRNAVLDSHPQAEYMKDTWSQVLYCFYNRRLTAQETADELDMTCSAIKSVIRKLKRRAERLDAKFAAKEAELSHASQLYAEGASVRHVSRQLGVSVGKACRLRSVHLKGIAPNPICGESTPTTA